MNGLEEQFGDRVDFVHLNVDVPEEFTVAQEYEMWRRSQYTLIDADGTIVKTWFGLLKEEQITADFEAALATLVE